VFSAIEKKLIEIGRLKPVEVPKLPQGRKSSVSDDDADAGGADHHISEDVGTAYYITYEDAAGEISHRRVIVRKVSKNSTGNIVLLCYCHERKAVRAFRIDRISEAVDLSTGEVIENLESHLNHICGGEISSRYPVSKTSKILSRFRYQLNILIFLGRCDGRLHPFEMDTIFEYLMNVAFDAEIDEKEVKEFVGHQYPDHDIYFASIEKLKPRQELQRVLRYACRMIQADEIITPDEHRFVEEMQQFL
jgi:hypothetical protein